MLLVGGSLLVLVSLHITDDDRPDLRAVGIPGVYGEGFISEGYNRRILTAEFSRSIPVWQGKLWDHPIEYRERDLGNGLVLLYITQDGNTADIVPCYQRADQRTAYVKVTTARQQNSPIWAGGFAATTVPSQKLQHPGQPVTFSFKCPDFLAAMDQHDLPALHRVYLWCPAQEFSFYTSGREWQNNRPDHISISSVALVTTEQSGNQSGANRASEPPPDSGGSSGSSASSGNEQDQSGSNAGEMDSPPVLFTGIVSDYSVCKNSLTGQIYHVVTVHSYGLIINVLLPEVKEAIKPGGIAFCTGHLYGRFK